MPPRGDTVQILQSTLQTAISQRGRYYKQVLSLAFRFEADDTQANRDTGNFQNILKALKLYEAVELVLSAGDPTPGWTLTDKLRTLLVTRHKIDGRVLVIIHYAGHGALNASDKLIFLANPNSPTSLSYDGSLSILENDDYTQDTDVIIILDSCYSGTAARAMDIKDRSIEIVASVGYDQQALGNSSQLARLQNKTFTSRLADEVAKQVGQGVTSVSLAELVTRLRETSHQQRKPVYRLKVGTTAIRVPNQGSTSVAPHLRLTGDQRRQMSVSQPLSGSSSTPSAQNLTALFKVHTNTDNPTGEPIRSLVDWVHNLDPALGIEIVGVYKTDSAVLILEAPYQIWIQLDGLVGVSLIAETVGHNYLPQLSPKPKVAAGPSQILTPKENLPSLPYHTKK